MEKSKFNPPVADQKSKVIMLVFMLCTMLFAPSAFAQFTTDKDTLVILQGDSTTYYYDSYNSVADTSGGTPYDWKTINYEGTEYTFTPETNSINLLKPQVIYALKRYIRFGCLDSGGAWDTEAARRKMVPLIRSAF